MRARGVKALRDFQLILNAEIITRCISSNENPHSESGAPLPMGTTFYLGKERIIDPTLTWYLMQVLVLFYWFINSHGIFPWNPLNDQSTLQCLKAATKSASN